MWNDYNPLFQVVYFPSIFMHSFHVNLCLLKYFFAFSPNHLDHIFNVSIFSLKVWLKISFWSATLLNPYMLIRAGRCMLNSQILLNFSHLFIRCYAQSPELISEISKRKWSADLTLLLHVCSLRFVMMVFHDL